MSCGNISAASTVRQPTLEIAYRTFTDAHLDSWLTWISSCLARGSQRRALSELDEHLLKDIGITRLQALKEAGKPGWRK